MEATIGSALLQAGPIGVLALVLYLVLTRLISVHESQTKALTDEMRADREVLRQEFGAMRTEQRDAIGALQTEVAGLRGEIRSMTPAPRDA